MLIPNACGEQSISPGYYFDGEWVEGLLASWIIDLYVEMLAFPLQDMVEDASSI